MPSRRRPTITPRKRRRTQRNAPRKRARRSRPARLTSLPAYRRGTGFPPTMKMRHVYCRIIDMEPTLTGLPYQLFLSANGMAQPYGAATDTPMLFKQMSELYDHYRVLGSKCTFKIIPKYNNDVVTGNIFQTWSPVRAYYRLNDDMVDALPLLPVLENPGTKTFVISPNTAKGEYRCRLRYSPRKVFGNRVSIHDQTGDITSNPPEGHSFELSMNAVDVNAGGIQQYRVMVRIDYLALWSERKEFTNS